MAKQNKALLNSLRYQNYFGEQSWALVRKKAAKKAFEKGIEFGKVSSHYYNSKS